MAGITQEQVKIVREGAISEIAINRPDSMNALNPNVLQGIILAFERLVKLPDLRVVIIRGEGEKAFVAGADIRSMSELGPRAIADYIELGQRAMRAIETCPVPVIAAVNGYALGGGLELALACDLIFASEKSRVGQPEVNLGIIPGFGGTQRLISRCGVGTARMLIYSGDIIDGAEALRMGVIDRLCEGETLFEEVEKYAETLLQKGPLAIQGAKRAINAAGEALLLGGLRLEIEEFLRLFQTADREEGMQAFLQKRAPEFSGR
jgi:enoyl-CoA hydratase